MAPISQFLRQERMDCQAGHFGPCCSYRGTIRRVYYLSLCYKRQLNVGVSSLCFLCSVNGCKLTMGYGYRRSICSVWTELLVFPFLSLFAIAELQSLSSKMQGFSQTGENTCLHWYWTTMKVWRLAVCSRDTMRYLHSYAKCSVHGNMCNKRNSTCSGESFWYVGSFDCSMLCPIYSNIPLYEDTLT